ncbi:hypothetical protein BDY24DRAFT_402714 [Mrakia frigida]|uniref:uncharacterized protein n=1 Tax=Mrakia frigida TaxID=29902 RepID=UPI003FCBFF03
MPRYASFPGPRSSLSHFDTSTPRQTTHPSYYDSPFTPLARATAPHERLQSTRRTRSPAYFPPRGRSTSPPFNSHTHPDNEFQQHHNSTSHHHPSLEDRSISSPNLPPLSPNTLPSFKDFLSASSTPSTTSTSRPPSLPSPAYRGAHQGLPLIPVSTFTYASPSSNQGLVSSSFGNESSFRSTGPSSVSSSTYSSSSRHNPPTPSSFSHAFPESGSTFTHSPSVSSVSRERSTWSDGSATEKHVSPLMPVEKAGMGIQSMEIEEQGRAHEGGAATSKVDEEGGLGVRALPGMLDVVGFGGKVGLGKFSVDGNRREWEW